MSARDAIAVLVEHTGADAVVLLYTVVRRDGTRAATHTWGNALACRQLIENAAAEVCDEPGDAEE